MDKNKALVEFINTYPQVYSWVYFNTITMLPGNTSLITDSDKLIREYIDGSQYRKYIFNIAFVHNYDTNTSDINIDAMAETDNFIKWVEEQSSEGNYPLWDETIDSMEVLSKLPILTVDPDNNTAQYVIQMQINYLKGFLLSK